MTRLTVERLIIGFGVISGITALFLSVAYSELVWIIALLALSSLVLLFWYIKRNVHIFKVYSGRRTLHIRFNLAITVALVLFITVMLNLISRQFYIRMDVTSTRQYSLSEQSIAIMEKVDKPIQLMYFGSKNSREFARVRYLLDAYRYNNRNILYRLLDLDSVPVLAGKYGVQEYDTVVVDNGERFFKDRGGKEQTITNLILKAIRKKRPRIRFLQGHGERSLLDDGRSGYGRLKKVFLQGGYDVEELNLLQAGGMPDDIDLLVIGSPEKELKDEEYQMIFDYIQGGGKMLLLLDSPKQLTPLLSSIYIRLSPYPVYDTQYVAGMGPSAPLIKRYYENPITGDFGLATFFPGVYEIKFIGSTEGYTFRDIVRASENAWYEKNGDGIKQKEEQEGLQRLAAVLVPKDELYRVAIFGDSDFVSNAYIGIGGNGDLFIRTVNWLLTEGYLTSIASNPGEVIPIFLTERQSGIIRLFSVATPFVIFFAGTVIWFKRKRL